MLVRFPMQRSGDLPRLSERPDALNNAISRVFPERASFELREDDVEALRKQLRNGHLTSSGGQIAFLQTQQEVAELAAWKKVELGNIAEKAFKPYARGESQGRQLLFALYTREAPMQERHPCLLTHLPHFFRQAKGKRLTVFMDYDGTLTPIVKDPDRAYMSDQMRSAVKAVAELFPTAIISGRGREKVEEFVKLNELFYAGSHGMDIVGPLLADSNGHTLAFQPAAKFEPVMDRVYESLLERTRSIPGAAVEHNKFCVSVHFRNCEPERLDEVVSAVEAVLASEQDLKATRGRKVLEIRPEVEWNKGHALAHLLGALKLGDTSDVMPIYIGDDRTDEDAFAVLNRQKNGVGILVSSKVKPTEAIFALRDPVEVMTFLTRLVKWGRTQENGWHVTKACCGWQLNADALLKASLSAGDSEAAAESDSHEIARHASGRPPLCPSEKSRQAAVLLTDARPPAGSSASPSAAEEASETTQVSDEHREANGHAQQQKAKGIAALNRRPPPGSPFRGSPLWASTLTSRQRGAAAFDGLGEPAAASQELEGADPGMDSLVAGGADRLRGGSREGDVDL